MQRFLRNFLSALVYVVALGSVLNCGSENVSHPNIEGDWILTKQSGQDVPIEEQVALRVTATTIEARDAQTGSPQFGGPRTYHWSGGVMVLDHVDGQQRVSEARVLSTANQSMEVDRLFDWPRSAFKRYSDKEWNSLVKLHEEIQKEHAAGGMALLADGKTWDRKFLDHLQERAQGLWEKEEGAHPYPAMGLIVEIRRDKIRAQAFKKPLPLLGGFHQILLGKDEPCTLTLKSPRQGEAFCPNNGKTYPMGIRFSSATELEVEVLGFQLELKRSNEPRVASIIKDFRVSLLRIPE